MKKRVRIMCFLLTAMLSISLFAGCTSDKSETEVTQTNTTTTSTTAPSTAAETATPEPEITYTINWLPQNDAPTDEDSPVKAQLEEILNVKLNFIYLDRSKEVELLNLQIASGEIPDVMRLRRDTFFSYVDQGILAEVPEDLVKEEMPTVYTMTLENSMDDHIWEYPKVNGKSYGIPSLSLNGSYAFISVWRDDWLKNVGIDKVPETIIEAEEAFYKFVNDDPDQNGENDTYALSNNGINVIFGAYGGLPLNNLGWTLTDSGDISAAAVMPEMKDALTLLAKWYNDGLIDPEFITGENQGEYWANTVPFWNGKIGFSCPGYYYHVNTPYYEGDSGSTLYQNFKQLQGEAATYALGTAIVGSEGKSGTLLGGTFGGKFIAMGKDVADEPGKLEKILQIFEKIATDYDFYMLERFGIEGVHYEMKQVGDTEQPSRISEYSSAEAAGKIGLSTNGIGYIEPNNFEFLKKSDVNAYAFADQYASKEGYNYALIWGLLPSTSQYSADLIKIIKENYILFITGERSIDEFDSFVTELNDAGLAQLTQEANEWYSQYHQ